MISRHNLKNKNVIVTKERIAGENKGGKTKGPRKGPSGQLVAIGGKDQMFAKI